MYRTKFIYTLFLLLFLVILVTVTPLSLIIKGSLSETGLPERVINSIIERLFIIAFYAFVLVFLIGLFFSRSITAPLNLLKRSALRVREGDLDFEIPQKAIGEFREVITTFNIMLKGLKEKTEELKKKELYIEHMTDPLIVLDKEGRIIDINPAFTKLLEYSKEEITSSGIEGIIPTISGKDLSSNNRGLLPQEGIALSKKGDKIPVLITISPVSLDNSQYYILTLKDFREGLSLREEIKISRDYLENIMNSIQDELMVIDRDFRVIKANEAVKRQVGVNPEGKFCYTLSHNLKRPCEESDASLKCPVRIVFETKQPFIVEHEHKIRDDVTRTHEIIAYPVIGDDGEVEHVIEFIRDITEKKAMEDVLKRRNRELSLLNEVAGILSRSLRADEIFHGVLEKLKETFDMDGGGIFFIEREVLICKYHSGVSEEFVRQAGRLPLGHDIPGKVAQSGMVITSRDVSKDPRLERSILKYSGIKGYCCIPVRGKERIHGVFCLFGFRPYEWSHDDEEILKAVGEMMGLAFENISLYERAQSLYKTLKDKRQREIEDLSIMVDILSGTRTLEELIDSSLTFIRERLNPDLICLIKVDPSGDLLLRRSIPSILSGEVTEAGLLYRRDISSQESLSIKEGVILHIRDIKEEPRFYYHETFKKHYISSLTVPLSSGQSSAGCLSLYSKTPREFSEDEIHFLKIFSTVLGLSLERSEFYETILRQEALSATILDSIQDGVYTVDRDGYVTFINRAAEDILGLSRKEILGKRCKELISHGAEKPLCGTDKCPLVISLKGESSKTELEYINRFGKRYILEINALPLREPVTGNINGAVQVFRDVTGERELDRMKTEIIRSVSHEFRTPLTAIIGMTEMILNRDVTGERARQYLEIMHREGLRLSKMISELLDISRLEKRELVKFGPVDFKKIAEDIKEVFSDIIEKKSALLAFRFEGNLSGFNGDEAKIEQMLRNLIDNSLTYSDSGVHVSVIFKGSDDMIEISVTDTGWGIPSEDLSHLGERFYRGRHGERTKGTGLGLSLVKEIVKVHGGSLSIESEEGRGTTVKITLPVKERAR